MKLGVKFFALTLICLLAVACGGKDACQKLRCERADTNCRQVMDKIPYTPPADAPGAGVEVQLGTISYLVTNITNKVRGSAKLLFTRITQNANYKKIVYGMAMLFVIIYGIVIALGIAQPNPMELVVRSVKLFAVFYLLTSWANFQEIVVDFFEGLTDGLTTTLTTAIVGSGTKITAMDVFGFIDAEVLGLLLSPRFTSIIGAIMTLGNGVGIIIALMLVSVILSYLWTVIVSIQVYLMAAIARTLLYAISPIFIIFLLFQQTRSLFDGWLKQLINFSLQPIFLIGFMAFFNGIFFNYLDRMFEEKYQVCYTSNNNSTSGSTLKLSGFKVVPDEEALKIMAKTKSLEAAEHIPITQIMDVFTLFVVLMLGQIMVKMNQWAVQAAAQLSEGAISFTQTMSANTQMSQSLTKGFGDTARQQLLGK